MSGRAERRRWEREERRRERHRTRDGRVTVNVGPEGVIYNVGGRYDQGSSATLPPKEPGRHRWIAMASYVITEASVRAEMDHQAGGPLEPTFLDERNRLTFSVGCWDCEGQFPVDITPDVPCPASEAPDGGEGR